MSLIVKINKYILIERFHNAGLIVDSWLESHSDVIFFQYIAMHIHYHYLVCILELDKQHWQHTDWFGDEHLYHLYHSNWCF